jgi:hypothetical protein
VARGGPAAVGPFPGSARLKRRRLITPLFDRDNRDVRTAAVGTIRLLYRFAPRADAGPDSPVQIGFAVPTRIKRATERGDETLTIMAIFRGSRFDSSVAVDADQAFSAVIASIRGRQGTN